jgi:DNA-binding HxlR family transcriptional regulator
MLKVTADSYEQAKDCPFRSVLDKVGDKWSFLVFAVLEDGPKRFNAMGTSRGLCTRKVRRGSSID